MLSAAGLRQTFESPLFNRSYSEGDHAAAPAALPDAALDFLVTLAGELGVGSVFEFGSGRSTVALLRAGFTVTSLEDSAFWMGKTVEQLSAEQKSRHVALVQPLRFRLHGLIPVKDWQIDDALAQSIAAADLILVDSPSYAPFRESTLWSALFHNNHAVVVLDDTRIHTLGHFCDRIAATNPALLHRRVPVGHSFDVFTRGLDDSPLKRSHTLLDMLKGCRRFLDPRAHA